MDKPEQGANREFEGGIFSGGTMQEAQSTEALRMDNYFDYARGMQGKWQDMHGGQQPERNPQDEGRQDNGQQPEQNPQDERRQDKEAASGKATACQPGQPKRVDFIGQSGQEGLHLQQNVPGVGMPSQSGNCGCGSCRCMHCPNGQKPRHTMPEVLALVAVVGLVIALLAVVLCLVKISAVQPVRLVESSDSKGAGLPYLEEEPSKGNQKGWDVEKPMPEAGNGGDYYGEIEDAIRTDLDYSIEWENYEYGEDDSSVMIAVDYPVIKGDVPNLDAINDVIDDETEYFQEYYKEYSKYMMPEEKFLVYSEGFVTYMDSEVMSVVFCEMIYTDYWSDYGLYCLNIDMENGVVLDNNSIIEINDEFAVDFRKRCRQQNGTVNDLDSLTDQEIVYYLTSGGTSILFYTPMGIEVGMNFGEYYVTVTYKDYEDFLKKY
ncbi:MAG: hypothetical protein HFI03_01990 [Lachnospiraceae bacterium]|jgi:hypothetical protein|nr:hypothetical protein [Lachnospiraceae bacterium]